MKLIVKFNLVFIVVFLLGLGVAGWLSWNLLQRHARDEIVQSAKLVMETAVSARSYTSGQVRPLLATQLMYNFLPQSVPAYSASEVIGGLKTQFPEYTYKDAMLNPTNPRDRATDWETGVIEQLRKSSDSEEIVGERDTPTGGSFFIARAIRIKDPACLGCHGAPESAPTTMVEKYGTVNGYGWVLNDVIGAQLVSVPTDVPVQRATRAFHTFMLSLGGVFVFIGVVLNVMLYFMVIRPVTQLSAAADQVSLGQLDAHEFTARAKDEIGTLTESFNRMRRSLVQAMKMLEQ